MVSAVNHNQSSLINQKGLILLVFSLVCVYCLHFNNPKLPEHSKSSILLYCKEGYDAKTGKWVNKKPSLVAFPISPEVYQEVKNWFSTDSGANNPNNLPIMAPKEGFSYIFTPYKDKAHPNVHGMSLQGDNGFKGYWYADDLTKCTDSSNDLGEAVPLPPVKDNSPKTVEFGGYDARTGNWVHTEQSDDAFPVSPLTYQRVKNWYQTDYGVNNPLGLDVQVPKEDFTYLYVPFHDPKHPGVIGLSFGGGSAYKGFWYADKIGETKDTIVSGNPVNNTQPEQENQMKQTAPNNTNNAQQVPPQNNPPPQKATPPPVNNGNPSSEGNQPK